MNTLFTFIPNLSHSDTAS